MPGMWELLIVLAIVLLIFGGKRLKNLGGDLGSAIRGFKKSMSEDKHAKNKNASEEILEAKIIEESKISEEEQVKNNS